MKTKTIKTPLMMTEAYGLSSCPSCLVPKNKFLHRPEVQSGFVPKLSHHGGKNTAIAEKHSLASLLSQLQKEINGSFSVERSETVFLPLMMSFVAQQRVVMAGLAQELALRHGGKKHRYR